VFDQYSHLRDCGDESDWLSLSVIRVIPVNIRDPQALIEKLKNLPPELVAKVDDFVEFLRTREERALERAAMRTAEPAFVKVWDNDSDAAYDKL
jgi:hypothetical protein